MAKRREAPAATAGLSPGFGWGLAAAVGVLALVGLTLWNRAADTEKRLSDRLASLETKLDGLEKSLQAVRNQPPPQQQRRGVDPNRVYTVNTAGAPIKGPGGAAVTIVEVSDFQ